MERAYGLEVPRTLEDVCDPRRLALLVYDMQVGIVEHVPNPQATIAKVQAVLAVAREAGVRTFFSRHLSLPKELMGVSQHRTAMAWQRVNRVADTRCLFSPGPPRAGAGQHRLYPVLARHRRRHVLSASARGAGPGPRASALSAPVRMPPG